MKQILDVGLDYISSEESGEDNVTLYKHPLPWLKIKYVKCMKTLDTIHYNSLSTKSKRMVRKRENGESSQRSIPMQPLSFAVNVPDDQLQLEFDTSIEEAHE